MLTFNPNPATSNTIVGRTTRFLSNNWHHLLLASGAIGGFVYFGNYTATPILQNIVAQIGNEAPRVAALASSAITKVGLSVVEALVAYSAVIYPILTMREAQKTSPLEKRIAGLRNQLATVSQTQVKAQIAEARKELEAAAQLIAQERASLEAQKVELNKQSNDLMEQVKSHAKKVATVAKSQDKKQSQLDNRENELKAKEEALNVQEEVLKAKQDGLNTQEEALTAKEQSLTVQEQLLQVREQELVELKSSLSQHAATPGQIPHSRMSSDLDSSWESLNNDNLTEGETYPLTPPSPTVVNAFNAQVQQDRRGSPETLLEGQRADNAGIKSRSQSRIH